MAQAATRLVENAAGDLFVDSSCIDCQTCRQLAPQVFSRSAQAGQSIVARQPAAPGQRHRALMALVACPTASIGTARKDGIHAAVQALPEEIEDGVFYCGFAAESSYGASSYLIRRPEGNVLVDSPRAARPLMRRLAALGGVRFMFLTHRDDVADHQTFRQEFGCARILHAADVSRGTAAVERKLQGETPVALAPDLLAIPVPGHTRGSTALLYRERFLFSGDHLWRSESSGRLSASRAVCWHSWEQQLRSLEALLAHRFEWLLPGHGRRWKAPSAAAMHAELEELLLRL
jgi:glyoxylase-like metal-dependent hydrolase (beta-lactamase superfamily II)/ferredoxin